MKGLILLIALVVLVATLDKLLRLVISDTGASLTDGNIPDKAI